MAAVLPALLFGGRVEVFRLRFGELLKSVALALAYHDWLQKTKVRVHRLALLAAFPRVESPGLFVAECVPWEFGQEF